MERRIPSLGIQGYSALLLCALLATLQGISNGDLLCSCKGSCRRSFDAMVQLEPLCGPSVNYSHIFLLNWQTLKTTKRRLRRQSTLQRISNGDLCSSMGTCRRIFDATVQLAPLNGPSLIRSPNEQTLKTTKCELQRISNGDLLCSGKGSCRRSFPATVQLEPLCGLFLNCCYLRSHHGQTVKSTKSELQLQSALQRISNGDQLCLFDKGPCRRSFDAGLQCAQLALHGPQVDRGWRNKCEFTIGRNAQGAVEVGFILRILSDGSQVIGSVQDVPLVPECMQRLCAVVAAFVENSSFPIYDRKARCGVWRTVLSRVNPKGDMLVMLQTTTIKEEERSAFVDPLVAELAATGLGICAIYHLYNDEVTDAPRPNALVTSLHGKPRLEMPMLELKLEIGPLSFFNPNTTTCRFLMETAIRYLKLRKSDILLDIFCGIGTIGLCAAGYCAKVIGVDIVQENIEDARRNAQQNSIPNTEFIVGKAEEVVPKILGDMDTSLEVVAVVDPSRAAMPSAPQKLGGGGGKKAKESLPALCWQEKGKLSEQDQVRCNNLAMLDLVIGTWTDQDGSTYSVQLDSGPEQSSCTVFTTRPSGRTIKTHGLIRIRGEQAAPASHTGNSIMYNDGDHLSRKLVVVLRHKGGRHLHKRADGFMLLREVMAQLMSRYGFSNLKEGDIEEVVRNDRRGRFEFCTSNEGRLIRATSGHSAGNVVPDLICRPPTRNVEAAVPTVGVVYDAPGPPLPDDSGRASETRRAPQPADGQTSLIDDEALFRPSSSDSEEDSEQVQDELRRLRQENDELKEERQRLLQEVEALRAKNAELCGQSVGPKRSKDPWRMGADLGQPSAAPTPPVPDDPWQNGADPWQIAASATGQPRPSAPTRRQAEDTQQTPPNAEPAAAPTSGQPWPLTPTETTSENLHQGLQEPWEQNEPLMLRVSGCEHEYFANGLHGKYFRLEEQSCQRPVYKRETQAGERQMVLFFWECADDPGQSGWYFCPSVDEECETWAFCAGDSDHPPIEGWVAPYNTSGEVNPSFRVEATRTDGQRCDRKVELVSESTAPASQICWGGGFTLDRARAAPEEIIWQPRKTGWSKSFKWTRKTVELTKQERRAKVAALREQGKGTKGDRGTRQTVASGKGAYAQEPLAIEDATDSTYWDEESDDDDIVAEPHKWKYERRPIPIADIRWSQETVGIRFRDGTLLFDTLQQMLDGSIKPDILPTFRVVLYEDLLYAVTGNRRLWVLKAYQRLSGRPVRVIAECHPPAAMETQWCKRRYSTTSKGQSVRFVCKSFADCTYTDMQDALWAANLRKHAQSILSVQSPALAASHANRSPLLLLLTLLETKVADAQKAEEEAKEAKRASELAEVKARFMQLTTQEVDELEEECSRRDAEGHEQYRDQGGGTVVDDDAATTELPHEEGEQETPLEVFPATDDEEEVDCTARKALNSLLGVVPDQSSNSYMPVGLQTAAQQLLADPYSGSLECPSELTPEGWVDCSASSWQATLIQEDGVFDFPGYFEPDWSLVSQTWQCPVPAAAEPAAAIQPTPFQVWQMHFAGQLAQLGFMISPSQVPGGDLAELPCLHPRLVDILRGRTQVLRIVYISCNVESMAEDVAKLGSSTEEEADDFVPVRTVAVDSFPQTVHVEAIQLLERASIVEDPRKRQKTAPAEEDADATETAGTERPSGRAACDNGASRAPGAAVQITPPLGRPPLSMATAAGMPPQRQSQHEKILRAFRTALPESGYWTEKQVRVLLNALGVELSEERLRSMIDAVSSGSGKAAKYSAFLRACDRVSETLGISSWSPGLRGGRRGVLGTHMQIYE
eukprot:s2414_g5.t5